MNYLYSNNIYIKSYGNNIILYNNFSTIITIIRKNIGYKYI